MHGILWVNVQWFLAFDVLLLLAGFSVGGEVVLLCVVDTNQPSTAGIKYELIASVCVQGKK